MNNFRLVLICLLFSQISLAQQINLKGDIVIDNLEEPISLKDILIINKQTEETALTDENGSFNINVRLNDELVITSNFTDKRRIIINENLLQKGNILIHLDLEVIELTEANVKPLKPKLEDNIDVTLSDIDKFKKSMDYFESVEFKQVLALEHADKQAQRAITQNGGGVNLLGFGQAFIKPKIKNKKKEKFNFEVVDDIKNYFTINYFINDLKIPNERVNEFVSFCFNRYNHRSLFLKNNITEMIMHYEKEAPLYLNKLNIKN